MWRKRNRRCRGGYHRILDSEVSKIYNRVGKSRQRQRQWQKKGNDSDTVIPAIWANCDWRSWYVLCLISPTSEDQDSNTSSTSKDFNFNCMRSTPARDVSMLRAVAWKECLPVLRGKGVWTKVRVIFKGCIMSFSMYILDACAVNCDLYTSTKRFLSPGFNRLMLNSSIQSLGEDVALLWWRSTNFKSEIRSERSSCSVADSTSSARGRTLGYEQGRRREREKG